MKKNSKNSELWSSKFGDDYTKRQKKDDKYRYDFFDKALFEVAGVEDCESVCEFGANIGENLIALKKIFKLYSPSVDMQFGAIEINENCCNQLIEQDIAEVYCQSVEEPIIHKYDLVFTRGVLIHLPEKVLDSAIKNIYNTSNKFILICEYHSPKREMIEYRGMKDMMWRDDYFKPFIDKGCDMIDCGFDYKFHITWALFHK